MTLNHVDLERFWLPEDGTYTLTPAGWLDDPTDEGLFRANAAAVSTGELAERQCVVLLGEPGMGKTSTLAAGRTVAPQAEGIEGLHVDLGRYGSEDRLVREVFQSEQIRTWQAGNHSLCLTLDSFDEAKNRVETLDQLLDEFLMRWDCDRLFLRVACRTADWPQRMRTVLENNFSEVNIHELLPLRRSDAADLMRAAELDAEEILAAVEQARIVPLAARPLTLKLIQSSISQHGSLPGNARELYEHGLTALLDEMNPQRQQAIAPPGGVAGRMRAAERIAALSLFGGRPTVWRGSVATAPPDDLSVDQCVGPPGRDGQGISSDDVHATLRSGIFTGAGEGRLGWSHATFADYLSARWVLHQSLDNEQVTSLLVANDGRIYTRARQVAAWLVALDSARFRHLIQSDPAAFLASVDLPEDQLRSEVVSALLHDAQSGELFDDYDVDYSGLQHSGLAEQLRPALQTPQGEACRVAVRIARSCSLMDSVPDLTTLALNNKADPHVRASAAMAIHGLSAAAPSHALTPLIGASTGPVAVDTAVGTQELEAAALLASWPHAVSTEEVFSVLSPSYPRSYYGLYSVFVDRFAKGLRASDLRPACRWLLADPSRMDDFRLAKLVRAVLKLCLAHLDDESAREVIVAMALKSLADSQPLFGEPGLNGDEIDPDTDTRHAVTRLLLETVSEEQVWWIVDEQPGRGMVLVYDEDLEWLIDVYAAADGTLRENAGRAARELLKPHLAAHSSIILELPEDHAAAELFRDWRSVVELDSEAAVEARQKSQERARRRLEISRRRKEERSDDWVNPRIAEEIGKAVDGDTSAFWRAAHLAVMPGMRRDMDEFQPDLTVHPRWETLPGAVKADFVTAARIYVETGECQPHQWLARNIDYRPARAGYQALALLLKLDPPALNAVSPEAWRNWAPILIAWIATNNGASHDDKQRLLTLARPHAEDELRQTILVLVDKAIADEAHVFLRTELEVLSTEVLARELLERLTRPMAPDTRAGILDFLVERHLDLVAPVLHSRLGDAERIEDPELGKDAACRLLRNDATRSWAALGALMKNDAPFMEAVSLQFAQAFDRRTPDLAPQALADLYLWLCERFPRAQDTASEDTDRVRPRESLAHWRDALLTALSRHGTRDAVAAIERIALARPDEPWMARFLVDAKHALRERSWEPLTLDEIDQLAQSRRTRVVRSDADLLAATLHALDEIEARLQADTPSAFLLWDTHSKRPKREEEISDYLANELEQHLNGVGVVVNREVQVRRSGQSGLAERTDLRVEAVRPDSGAIGSPGTLRIPGEVKGVWNPGLIESLETQLVQRYMADFQTDHGLYVVAWFDQESWATADGRRSKAARQGSVTKVRTALEAEAENQRAQGRVISVRVLDFSLKRPTSR